MKTWFENGRNNLSDEEYNDIKSKVKKLFSINLKKIRKASGLTLKELSSLSGTSDSYLSQLENGRRNPPKPDLLLAISKALVTTKYPIKGDPKIRNLFSDENTMYDYLSDKAGYTLNKKSYPDDMKEENNNNDRFKNSLLSLVDDFYLNYKTGEEIVGKNYVQSSVDRLRLILYTLNQYKNNDDKLGFVKDKNDNMNQFKKLLDDIEKQL